MAIDFMVGYQNSTNINMEEAISHEASAGLKSVHNFLHLLSQSDTSASPSNNNHNHSSGGGMEIDLNCKAVANDAVSRFNNVITLLGRARTGHARFRRGPVMAQPNHEQRQVENGVVLCPKPIQQVPAVNGYNEDYSTVVMRERKKEPTATITFSYSSPVVSAGNSLKSTLTGETTDSKNNNTPAATTTTTTASFQMTNYSGAVSSAGRPPLSHTSSFKVRKCHSENGKCGGPSGRCHCSKKRKMRLKRVVRVPAISLKMADIPPDDYSWRKYGQKPIKGSPHPRGYYKCSTVRGCPARKHVERALDDANMLVVTYEGEHNHSLSVAEASTLILESS